MSVYQVTLTPMILYYKPTCPYCVKVLDFANEHGISFELRDIVADDAHAEALIARGGKRQVPYLIDEANGVEMYESNDIIEHLRAHHVTS